MHKTIILDKFINSHTGTKEYDFCYTDDRSMFICLKACEHLAKQKSSTRQYVATFAEEYSKGYRKVRMNGPCIAWVRNTKFFLAYKQQKWIKNLGLKTLRDMVGHFYVKITPFE